MGVRSLALPHLHTERLTLRLGTEADIPGILSFFEVNREFFRPTDPARPRDFHSETFWRELLRRSLQDFFSDQSARFFIFRKTQGV